MPKPEKKTVPTKPEKKKRKRGKKKGKNGLQGKMALKTNFSDYGGSLRLPEKIVQGEHETVGQFMRRIDRLAAKAKVEASMEARFDIDLNPNSS